MKEYFGLQLVITNRKIREAGINPVLGYALRLAILVWLSEYAFQKTGFAKYILALTCLGFQLKYAERDRTDFLRYTFGDRKKKKIRILENLIVCIPFVGLLIYHYAFSEALLLLIASVVLATFSFRADFNFSMVTPFSKRPFEFATGFRKTFFIFPVAYALTVMAVYVGNLNLGLFSILLIFLTTLSFYTKAEKEYYVWVHAQSPQAFLKNKMIIATRYSTLLVSPVLIGLLVFYPLDYELILIFFIAGLSFLYTIILARYAAYPREINMSEGVLIAISLSFPPLLLAVIPFFYHKAIKKLKPLLDDHH